MDLFEYILIMTSVIFAMAVAQLLLGLSRLAQSSLTVRPYLAHSIWVVVLFIMIFANWWANWEFRSIAWTLPVYAYMLIAPTLFFSRAHCSCRRTSSMMPACPSISFESEGRFSCRSSSRH